MPVYSDKFKGFQNQPTNDDLTDLVNAIIDNVMRNLHVSTLAIVTKVNSNSVYVKPFPTNEGEDSKEIEVLNSCGLTLDVKDKVIILFMDRDFRQNLNQLNSNPDAKLTKNVNKEKHCEKFGIIINKLV